MRPRSVLLAVAALSMASALGAAPWVEKHARPHVIPQNLGAGPAS